MEIISPWYYLGYIIPHPYTDLDAYQFYHVAPEGMVLVTTGLHLKGYNVEAVEKELGSLWDRLDILVKRGVDRIAISGVPLASMLGRDRTLELLEEARTRSGLPCDTDMEAHVAALGHMGIDKVVMLTRWPESLNEAVVRYLAEVGVETVAYRALKRTIGQNKAPDAARDHQSALEMGDRLLTENPDAQALFMPGGPWFAIYAAQMLEAKFGKPVFMNIISTTWAALNADLGRIKVKPDRRWKVLASIK